MKLSKDILIGLVLLFILFICRHFYEEYRLFLIFIPSYICILYLTLKNYYNDYSLMRFPDFKLWIKNNLMIIFEHCIISSMVLCLDKLFISTVVSDMNIALLWIEYFLFLVCISGLLILPYLNIMRPIISSIALLIVIKTRIFNFFILNPLFDGRQFNIENGILKSIAVLLAANLIIYVIYFIILNKKVRSYGYDAFKKTTSRY